MAVKQVRDRTSGSGTPVSVSAADSVSLVTLPDDDLLETVQRQTFNFFWEGAHPQSGLAFDRRTARRGRTNHKTAGGGSGFVIISIIVAVERSWITLEAALDRLGRVIDVLIAAEVYQDAFLYFSN